VDISNTLDELQGEEYKSAIDVKAGFFIVKIAEKLKKFAGLVTQDALYVFQRMAFGYAPAPATFQGIMNVAIQRAKRPLITGTYLDDCTVGGQNPKQCWDDTLEAIECLLRQGLPINLGKCKFVLKEIEVLGVVLTGDNYKLGRKALANLFATKIPTTLNELQSLLGKLNHCAPFVLGYKRLVQPLVSIMSGDKAGQWRLEHTEALNELGELIHAGLSLTLVDQKQVLKLHVDADNINISVVMTQPGNKVCGLAGRKLTVTEARCSLLERLLIAAVWGFKRFRRYCDHAPAVYIVFPHPAELCIVNGRDPPVRI
jgi:hypothetical protein